MLRTKLTWSLDRKLIGFIMMGCPVAFELGISIAPVRKPGKLPREVISADYEKEEVLIPNHASDAIKPGQREAAHEKRTKDSAVP